MTIPELNNKLGNIINDFGDSGKIMLSMANYATNMIKTRVIETGINAKNEKFAPYSTKSMLANCSSMTGSVCSKIAGSKDKRRELKWVTLQRGGRNIKLFELPEGYKQMRELHGRQTNHVDFSFYNNMWNDINVKSDYSQHQRGIAIIGAKQDIEKKKLEGNTKRRGDILDLNQKEIDELKRMYNLNVLQIFKNNGL